MKRRTIGDIEKIKEVIALLKQLRKEGIITSDELSDIRDILYRA